MNVSGSMLGPCEQMLAIKGRCMVRQVFLGAQVFEGVRCVDAGVVIVRVRYWCHAGHISVLSGKDALFSRYRLFSNAIYR
ncbi:hypothetical protein E2C01_073243 [Portunus trituberculatus]|uniref:Uncharacterized protein n=1 Tax=Portunus trituberculatus TaxID=210409 RepID=A0A5B7IA25_PORTR|nr:hypothetical protein [Portunus trituberculatus]